MEQPVITKILGQQFIGNVDATRGTGNLFNPPIVHEDNYKWIRDDSRKDPKVLSMLELENEYLQYLMVDTKNTQKNIYNELLSNIQEDFDTYPLPPTKHGRQSEYYYFTRFIKDKSYPLYYRNHQSTQKEQLLVDVNVMVGDHKTFDLSGFKLNEDQTIMSYGIDTNGSEKYNLHIRRIDNENGQHQEIEHDIPPLMYCAYRWVENCIYYYEGTDQNRLYRLWKYNLDTKENVMLYQCDDELFHVGLDVNEDYSVYFLYVTSEETTNLFYFEHVADGIPVFHEFTESRYKHKYSVSKYADTYYITTNKDDSVNFKVMATQELGTAESNWYDVIPYNKNQYISYLTVVNGFMLIDYKELGNTFLKVIPFVENKLAVDQSYIIQIDDEIKNLGLIQTVFQDKQILFYHTSMSQPLTYYEYDLVEKTKKEVYRKPVPNYDSTLYATERIYSKSHDGVMVPMSVIYRKDKFQKDGTNPLYLYGYGAYGHTVDPNFNKGILPLLNRGFVYVIAHVRGGSFLGYQWYEDGKMKKKMNTFLDFIACAEHLIAEQYTGQNLITIEGRSAGGLLVGASMVLRPELFRTVVAGVPFVDVINTMIDPSIPLTVPEWEQWGNPNVQEDYDYIIQYSPYNNIQPADYPNVLALAGLHDPRVGYWEPAKFIAKLREFNQAPLRLLTLKTEMEQGHFGKTDRYKYLRDLAHDYAFVLKTYTE